MGSHYIYLHSLGHFFWTLKRHRFIKFALKIDLNTDIHRKYHVCWWPGDVRIQGVDIRGIGLEVQDYSGFSNKRVKWRRCSFITMTSQWTRWRLKTPASRLFIQPLVQTQIKENIKTPRHWPLFGEFTGHRWIPRTKSSNAENVSICWRHLVIKSSWYFFKAMHAVAFNKTYRRIIV